jgi:hypothetical protein
MQQASVAARPIPSRLVFARRLVRNALFGAALVGFSLGIGAAGYHEFVGLDWLDATLNASMILTGMGPLAPFATPEAKLFGIFYSLFSGVAFLSFAAVLLGPVAHRFLHRFHLDLYEGERDA